MNTVLFGFDLVVIVGSIMKLLADEFGVPEKVIKYLSGLLTAAIVVVVGLQSQGAILGPGTEQWVALALSALTAMLATWGYGPPAVATGLAIVDYWRFKAVAAKGQADLAKHVHWAEKYRLLR